MKPRSLDVDSIPRWRDRPDGASDEDRAAALTRDALASDAFPIGLDDEQLRAVEASLRTKRHARPALWLRPALVAFLMSVSVASVMGYETGWFAPLRERLRFRRIPAAVPAPGEPAKRRAPRPRAASAVNEMLAPELPAPAISAAQSAPPPAEPERAPAPQRVATRIPKVALVVPRVPATAAGASEPAPAPPTAEPSPEIRALEHAMGLLRGHHDAPAALAALDDYLARYPGGALEREARIARVDALLMLHQSDEAMRALEALELDGYRRSMELQLIRGELRARADCARAEADFTAVLARVQTATLEERALYGRAACRSSQGNAGGAADDLRRYLVRFPHGPHADWARRWLQNDDASPGR